MEKEGNLDNWMQRLYENRDGKEEFNRINLLLKEEDLQQLQKDLTNSDKYFVKYCSKEEIDEYLNFIQVSLRAIDEDYSVYYKNSW